MGRAFTPVEISKIEKLIQEWPKDKITWEIICKTAAKVIGDVPTRQALEKHESIKEAYSLKKMQLKDPIKRSKLPSTLADGARRLELKQAEIETLKAENARLRDLCDVILYNAHMRCNLTEAQMLKDLPKVDRQRHDKTPPTPGQRKMK